MNITQPLKNVSNSFMKNEKKTYSAIVGGGKKAWYKLNMIHKSTYVKNTLKKINESVNHRYLFYEYISHNSLYFPSFKISHFFYMKLFFLPPSSSLFKEWIEMGQTKGKRHEGKLSSLRDGVCKAREALLVTPLAEIWDYEQSRLAKRLKTEASSHHKGCWCSREGLQLCEACTLTADFEARVQSEWRLGKIILVAWTVDGTGGGARWVDVGVLGPVHLCAVSALDQGAD